MAISTRKPRLKGCWQRVRSNEGYIYFVSELTNRRLRVEDGSGILWTILQHADGRRANDDIVEEVSRAVGTEGEDVRDGLRALEQAGLLEDAELAPPAHMPAEYVAAYRRNAFYFSTFEDATRTRYDMLDALYQSKVAVLGLGGTGTWVVAALLAAGIGTIRGVDAERVDVGNLGRQILYRREDVDRPKAEAMADHVAGFNPSLRFEGRHATVRSADDVREIVRGMDLLVVGCVGPRFTLYRWVNEACLAERVPFLLVETRQVGPLVVPGRSACYACYESHLRRFHPYLDQLIARLDSGVGTTERMPQYGPLVAYSAVRAAHEVARHLAGYADCGTVNRVLQIDGNDLDWKGFDFPRDPGCATCGGRNGA